MKRRKWIDFNDWSIFSLVVALLLITFVLLFSELIDCGYEIESAKRAYQEALARNEYYRTEELKLTALP
ncbi:MAG: hypothetical protein NC823_01795, partial [Candidatus Omnitrophica bacterium]|nr:hypothetical protein [Candidatus Omnitrophota bacterium]